MSEEPSAYAELTGRAPSEEVLALPHLSFFGGWTEERVQRDVLGKLLVRHGIELTSFQRSRCSPLPPDEPEAGVYMFPHSECGVALTVVKGPDGAERAVSLVPAAGAGTQHKVRIKRAHLLPNRIEAVIEASVLLPPDDPDPIEIPISFHDHRFSLARGFYQMGLVNDFIVCAFAKVVRPAEDRHFEVPRAVWMDAAGLESDPGKSTVTVDCSELATWMVREEIGLATHEFRGQIESVSLMPGETDYASRDLRRDHRILGVRVWRIRTLVLRDPDFHLDIFVSDADAGDQSFLQPGTWIEGLATMSGYCWW